MGQVYGAMFNYYQSHSLTKLAEHFSNHFEFEKGNPLQPSWIIVQNNEIKEWLSLQFAHHNEIAGNFRFIYPSEFMWVLFRIRNTNIPDVLPGDLNAMVCGIFELLSSKPEWMEALNGINIDLNSPKTVFHFSNQLADLFDQYQVYRPEMMEKWLEGRFTTANKDEVWQAEIWKQLNNKWQNSDQTAELPRRSEAHAEILKWIDDGNVQLQDKLPQNIYVFGLSHASAPFSEIITKLSEITNVHYYLTTPALQLESAEKQTVILDWATSARHHKMLISEGLRNSNKNVKPVLLGNKEEATFPAIKLHSCHNRRREVQVLKDEILRFLDNNPATKPSDILVMVPDPEKYSGIIESIFNDDGVEIPFSGIRSGIFESAEHTLSELLSLLNSPFKADRLLQFMHLESIKNKFEISESDLNIIEQWVVSTKIHFGLGNHFNTPHSWKKGLNQLISGFTMEAQELDIYKSLVPENAVSSSEQVELMAKFSHFIHALNWANDQIQYPKSANSWTLFIEELAHRFISNRTSDQLFKKLSKLKQQIEFTTGTETIDYELIKAWFINILQDHRSASGRFGKGVTMSSYVPYRSVPFQFIAMLGMNEETFPRKAVRPDYDLIYAKPKPGDRIMKEDDSHLFVETLQAAGQHLHLSYVGADQNTDARKLPSILIQQLAEMLGKSHEDLAIKHRLHPFNKKYFDQNDLRTYSEKHFEIASKIQERAPSKAPLFIDKSEITTVSENEIISVSDIISFFGHPCKYLTENVLDVRNYDRFNQIESRELFKLKGLDRYKLDDLLFKHLADERDTGRVFEYVKTGGMIPASLPGEKLFSLEKGNMKLLVEALKERTSSKLETVEINFDSGNHQIFGNIDGLSDNTFISFRVGTRRARHEIEHWLKHLILLQNGTPIKKSIYLSVKDNKLDILNLNTDNIPETTFNELFHWFSKEGLTKQELAFFPETSKAYAEEFLRSNNRDESLEKALGEWMIDDFKPFAESADYYNKLIWRNDNPLEKDAFHKYALLFWEPFFKSVEDEE